MDVDSFDSAPKSIALRTAQTGQNSIAPENRLPQLGQVRRGFVFMDLRRHAHGLKRVNGNPRCRSIVTRRALSMSQAKSFQ